VKFRPVNDFLRHSDVLPDIAPPKALGLLPCFPLAKRCFRRFFSRWLIGRRYPSKRRMRIIVSCKCGQNFATDNRHIGKRTECWTCGQTFVITAPRVIRPPPLAGIRVQCACGWAFTAPAAQQGLKRPLPGLLVTSAINSFTSVYESSQPAATMIRGELATRRSSPKNSQSERPATTAG